MLMGARMKLQQPSAPRIHASFSVDGEFLLALEVQFLACLTCVLCYQEGGVPSADELHHMSNSAMS